MNSMTHLIVATTVFLATHYVASTPLRARLVGALGNAAYLGLYSLVAFAALGWMIWAYHRAPFLGLWHLPQLRYVPHVIMPYAFILVAGGLLTRNPTLVKQENVLKAEEPARGRTRTGSPW